MRKSLLALTCAVALAAAGCSSSSKSGSSSSAGGSQSAVPQKDIRVAVSSLSLGQGLSMLAVDGGFLKARGFNAQLVNSGSASNALTAVASGSVEAYTANPATVFAVQAKTKMVMPLRAYSGVAVSLTLSKKVVDKAGLTASSPIEDRLKLLKGLTVATISAGSSTTLLLRKAAKSVGVTAKETYLEQDAFVAALQQGKIDGFVASSPYGQTAAKDGVGVDWVDGPGGQWPGYNKDYIQVSLGFTQSFAEKNADDAARILRAYLDASAFAKRSPDKTEAILRKRFSTLSDEIWNAMWKAEGGTVFNSPLPDETAVKFVYQDYVDQLASGSNATEIDIAQLLDPGLVAKAQALPAAAS